MFQVISTQVKCFCFQFSLSLSMTNVDFEKTKYLKVLTLLKATIKNGCHRKIATLGKYKNISWYIIYIEYTGCSTSKSLALYSMEIIFRSFIYRPCPLDSTITWIKVLTGLDLDE